MTMKKSIYIFSMIAMILGSSCNDQLNTEPTDKVSGSVMFASAESAETAINGIYRAMYVAGWSSGWSAENYGHNAIILAADLMGEDHMMASQGQGWFFEDYRLNVHGDFAGKAGRPYSFWNFYYTLISNANYIIAAEETMGGDPDLKSSVIAQAYAMRAFSYFYLIQLYQQTYKGNESKLGVPLYSKATVAGSEGAPRGTVQGVYDQINADLEKAISLFAPLAEKSQKHSSHIDYYVAQGLKARTCLVQQKFAEAAAAAAEAMKRPSLKMSTVAGLDGFNAASNSSVMWGFEVIPDQSSHFSSLFSHLDADAPGMYGSKAQQCISTGLYNLISETDQRRKAWFRSPNTPAGSGSQYPCCQTKFKMADYATRTGDYIVMRMEEMILIKAEAECHQGKFADARNTIAVLGKNRDANYDAILASRSNSKEYNKTNSNAPVKTLMEEILLQRRVELWNEAGRIFDIQRLGMGYSRVYDGSNHTLTVQTKNTNAASPLFILPLPQSEIDGNENVTDADQNEIVQ